MSLAKILKLAKDAFDLGGNLFGSMPKCAVPDCKHDGTSQTRCCGTRLCKGHGEQWQGVEGCPFCPKR